MKVNRNLHMGQRSIPLKPDFDGSAAEIFVNAV